MKPGFVFSVCLLAAGALVSKAMPPTHSPSWLGLDRQVRLAGDWTRPAQFVREPTLAPCRKSEGVPPHTSLLLDIVARGIPSIPLQAATNSVLNPSPDSMGALWQTPLAREGQPLISRNALIAWGKGQVLTQGKEKPAKLGESFSAGATFSTTSAGRLDLFLDKNGPALRLERDTAAQLTRLDYYSDIEWVIDTRIDLRRGRLLGNVNRLASRSLYLVRTRTSVIRIRGTEFQIDADGTCAILSGLAEVVTPTHTYIVRAGEIYRPPS